MKITRHTFSAMLVAISVLLTATYANAQETPPGHEVKVMTQNLYFGTDLGPVLAATSFADLIAAVTAGWAQVEATDFPARAELIADKIESEMPDLVGLQECVTWRSGAYNPAPLSATTVRYDFLQILMDALAARNLPYTVVAIETGTDAEAPGLPFLTEYRVTDHEVIIARTDRGMTFSNASAVNFVNNLTVSLLGSPLVLRRGYCSVDVRLRGKDFRFITTHLDPDHPVIQNLQSMELLTGPANTTLDVVYVGDLNSTPVSPGPFLAYSQAITAGFGDSWSVVNPADVGNTFGHLPTVLDPPYFTRRIDYVLFRGANIVAVEARLFGLDPDVKTATGLYPSDHAGVIVTLVIK